VFTPLVGMDEEDLGEMCTIVGIPRDELSAQLEVERGGWQVGELPRNGDLPEVAVEQLRLV